jgi:hypothetical protein
LITALGFSRPIAATLQATTTSHSPPRACEQR